MNDTEPFFNLTNKTIAIIGLGLMGGSLAAALKEHVKHVIGIDQNRESIHYAYTKGWIDEGYDRFSPALQKADWIIFATPVRSILSLLEDALIYLKPNATVFDLGSVKLPIMHKMLSLPQEINILGGHPMCGKESSGILNADKNLYQGATFVLTPANRTKAEVLQQGIMLVEAIGAKPLILSALLHDELVAYISHLPYVIACCLVNCVMEKAKINPDLPKLAASGFRDTTRLASSNLAMSLDILIANREAVISAIQAFHKELENLENYLTSLDEEKLNSTLLKAINSRAEIMSISH